MAVVLVPMAQGFEEMELTITVDVLRRGGLEVRTAALGADTAPVRGSRGMLMVPDTTLEAVPRGEIELLALPGGKEGSERLAADGRLLELVRWLHGQGRWVAAICAAPLVLKAAGIVTGATPVTSHPATAAEFAGFTYMPHRVVVAGRVVTSRAAGTTFEFATTLLQLLRGPAAVREVNRGLLALLPDQLPEQLA